MKIRIESTWDGRPVGQSESVELELQLGEKGLRIEVDAPFHNDPAPLAPPGPTPGLWEHEVVEFFISGPGDRYTEVELGPLGHHLLLLLDGPRNPIGQALPLDYECRVEGRRWYGLARLPWDLLPPGPHRINACAIHGVGVSRRYLSWCRLPGSAPDFHQPGYFADWLDTSEERQEA